MTYHCNPDESQGSIKEPLMGVVQHLMADTCKVFADYYEDRITEKEMEEQLPIKAAQAVSVILDLINESNPKEASHE